MPSLSELWTDLRYRARVVMHRDAIERELDAELRFHIEKEAENYERLGVSHEEALRRARLAFGGLEQAKELSRDSRGTAWLDRVVRDVRFATRSLVHQPTFTLAVVLTLTLGIAANTTVFTLLDALLLRPLPVPDPKQLVTIGDPRKVHSGWHGSPMVDYVSYPVYADIRDGNRVLSGVYATGQASLDVVVPGRLPDEAEHPRARYVSDNFFSVLQVPAFAGRTFAGDGRATAREGVAVISYGYWQRRLGGARSALGAALAINRVAVTIIGITPPGFTGDIVGESTDLWLPIALEPVLDPREDPIHDRTISWLEMMGRLAPGITLGQARAEISAIELRSIRAHLTGVALAEFNRDIETDPVSIEPGAQGLSEDRGVYASALVVLMAAVAVVMLVVCANISNLMLSRGVARAREMTVRMTLGANRRRLVAQLLTESAMLGAVSGALGLSATVWTTRVLLAVVASAGSPVVLDVRPDRRILAFTAGMTLLCVALFGLLPAFRVTRVDLGTALRAHGRSVVSARARLTRLFVVAQIALSTMLLVGTGLLVRSARQLLRADLGFDRDHLLAVRVGASKSQYVGARLDALREQLAQRARGVPGVIGASYSQEGLFSGGESLGHVDIGGVVTPADSQAGINYDRVGPGYFRAVGATLLRGRDFDRHDGDPGISDAVIDETMAKAYFPRGDAIGRTVTLDSAAYTIVGIVRDMQEENVRGTPSRRMYLSRPEPSSRPLSFELLVRVDGDPTRYVAPLRQELRSATPSIPFIITPLDDRIRQSISQDLLVTQVTAFFGIITLVLAAIGLYGVITYSISQRTGEFGLRIALGAEPTRVAAMIVGEALTLTAVGLAVGLPVGLAATRVIRDHMFATNVFDAPSLGVSALVLIGTTLVASTVPALRAARVAPIRALQAD